MKPPPQVPKGTSSLLTSPTENLSFHSSPESFLASRILQHHKDHLEAIEKREPVRAKILNRDVIILSSYHQIRQVLDPASEESDGGGDPPFVAVAPYRQLMEPFFPLPNLLLNDGAAHSTMKTSWHPCSHALTSLATSPLLKDLIRTHLASLPLSQPFDLYTMLKDLSWQIYLTTFVDLSPSDPAFAKIVALQEDLLRGQFSLLPVSVNVGLWHSPRKKGISAREKLQRLLEELLAVRRPAWLSHLPQSTPAEEIVNHTLMATSSLAVKATASFLLAFLLNMFIYRPPQPEARSWSNAAEISTPDERRHRVEAVVQETLRLSPPIVGVMRRATKERVIRREGELEPDVLIPKGWDVWCYFPGANRDHSVYGVAHDTEVLRPIRFHAKIPPQYRLPLPFAFGAGAKSCLGEPFVRQLAMAVYDVFASSGLELQGSVENAGVRGWLGWEIASPEQWAKGMKQLPTQRPSEAVLVRMDKTKTVYWKDPEDGVDITRIP